MGRQMSEYSDRARTLAGAPIEQRLKTEALEDHVIAAVRQFSSDRPQVVYSDFVGDGASYDLSIASMTAWSEGFSFVVAIESPQGQREPLYVDEGEISLYPNAGVPTHVRLLLTTPGTGDTTRVFYAAPWPIPTDDASVDDLGDIDFEPVCANAAARALLQLAAGRAGNTPPTIPGADQVDWSGESTRYRDVYRDLKKIYDDHVGGEAVGPASGIVDWDARSTYPDSTAYLFRGRR